MKDANNILMKFISTQGYKNTSPDVNNPVNVIPSNRITMKDVDFPVHGVDNLGNSQVMMPGGEYLFGGDYVIETPMYGEGGDMIRRADGSYSKRGLWDNIRANKGSGKKPTKEMLEQEKKIKKQDGGSTEANSLTPDDLNNWNNFIKYAKKSGASQDDRYNHDKKLGYELIKKYNQENPNAAIDKDRVKDYQSYFLNMAAGNTASGQMGVKTANSFKNGISKADGFLGLKTLNQMVPKISTEVNGVRTDYGADFATANQNFAVSQTAPQNLRKFVDYNSASLEQRNAFDEAMLQRRKQEVAAQEMQMQRMKEQEMQSQRRAASNPANYQEFMASNQSWAPAPDGGFYVKQYGGEMQPQQQEPVQQSQPDITNALGEIAMLLENGTSEDEVFEMLTEQGLSQEDASSILESAKNDIQEDGIEEEDADLDAEDIEEKEDSDEDTGDLSNSDDFEEFMSLVDDSSDSGEMKYGGIKINPKKKGTFKAQATKMGMSVQEAASHILANKEEYSPAMVKKANFAKNFAKELGGQLYEMAEGGSIPSRYKNMGFTKVGVKKQSTRPDKKWMVLAKKGDKYKVVHGGWKGMQDYSQHHSEKRQDRFWDRMGGKNSADAKDPFSPLYWHKRFGTWAEGGVTYDNGGQSLTAPVPGGMSYEDIKKKLDEQMTKDLYKEGDNLVTKTDSHTINSLDNNAWNRGLATANTLGDPRSMLWALPNKGFLGTVKGIAGAAAGLSGAILGYEKLFKGPKSTEYLVNADTKESGTKDNVMSDRMMKMYSKPEFYQDAPIKDKKIPGIYDNVGMDNTMVAQYGGAMHVFEGGGETPSFKDWFIANSMRADVMQNSGNQAALEEMWKKETAQNTPVVANTSGPANVATSVGGIETAQTPGGTTPPAQTSPIASKPVTSTVRGDSAGMIAANNALAGLGMVNQVLDARSDYQKEYEQRLRETGNTMNRYNPQNAVNPFGNYTLNAGPASNFGLVANTQIQDFGTKMSSARFGGLIPFIPATKHYAEGGEYYADEDEIKRILAMGGEIEFLD